MAVARPVPLARLLTLVALLVAAQEAIAFALGAATLAAASGAFVWALACPIDDPAYATLWHAVAFALIIGAARLWLPRLVRLRPRCPTREAIKRRLRRS